MWGAAMSRVRRAAPRPRAPTQIQAPAQRALRPAAGMPVAGGAARDGPGAIRRQMRGLASATKNPADAMSCGVVARDAEYGGAASLEFRRDCISCKGSRRLHRYKNPQKNPRERTTALEWKFRVIILDSDANHNIPSNFTDFLEINAPQSRYVHVKKCCLAQTAVSRRPTQENNASRFTAPHIFKRDSGVPCAISVSGVSRWAGGVHA